jgi:hypothetical protein
MPSGLGAGFGHGAAWSDPDEKAEQSDFVHYVSMATSGRDPTR